jgi:hypothetical protein
MGGMDSSLRNQLEASCQNKMDASEYGGTEAPRVSIPHEFSREQLLEQIVNPYIEDDSPAAEALRANAQIHIGKMSKVARSINAQALRKMVKKASMRQHFGKVKGKPPRVPPPSQMGDSNNIHDQELQHVDMYGIEEGESESEDQSASIRGTAPNTYQQQPTSYEQQPANDAQQPATHAQEPSTYAQRPPQGIAAKLSALLSEPTHFATDDIPPPMLSYDDTMELKQPAKSSLRSSNGKTDPKKDVVIKTSPEIITNNVHSGDHLHYSLGATKKSESFVIHPMAQDMQQTDVPEEVVPGTMEAGRKGMFAPVTMVDLLVHGVHEGANKTDSLPSSLHVLLLLFFSHEVSRPT